MQTTQLFIPINPHDPNSLNPLHNLFNCSSNNNNGKEHLSFYTGELYHHMVSIAVYVKPPSWNLGVIFDLKFIF